jgi:hypothetical protein
VVQMMIVWAVLTAAVASSDGESIIVGLAVDRHRLGFISHLVWIPLLGPTETCGWSGDLVAAT